MGMPSGFELLMIFGAVLLLFGGKKIPELAKGLGQGIKNFKTALSTDSTDDNKDKAQKIDTAKADESNTKNTKAKA
jgi:sec-independent protein translocase protein TatA